MENKPFVLILLALVVLIVLALWQFYSLAWGGSLSLSYHARAPNVAAVPQLTAAPDTAAGPLAVHLLRHGRIRSERTRCREYRSPSS